MVSEEFLYFYAADNRNAKAVSKLEMFLLVKMDYF